MLPLKVGAASRSLSRCCPRAVEGHRHPWPSLAKTAAQVHSGRCSLHASAATQALGAWQMGGSIQACQASALPQLPGQAPHSNSGAECGHLQTSQATTGSARGVREPAAPVRRRLGTWPRGSPGLRTCCWPCCSAGRRMGWRHLQLSGPPLRPARAPQRPRCAAAAAAWRVSCGAHAAAAWAGHGGGEQPAAAAGKISVCLAGSQPAEHGSGPDCAPPAAQAWHDACQSFFRMLLRHLRAVLSGVSALEQGAPAPDAVKHSVPIVRAFLPHATDSGRAELRSTLSQIL